MSGTRALAGLARTAAQTVRNAISRAVVALVDDSRKVQEVQVDLLDGETRDKVERVQNYGFTSVPMGGAEAIVIFVGSSRDHGVAVAVDDRRYRLKDLQAGEVAVFTDQGDKIVLKRGGTIEITASTKVSIVSDVEISGNLTVNGNGGVTVPTGDVEAGSISLKTHVHGGVQSGGGTTGAPQ